MRLPSPLLVLAMLVGHTAATSHPELETVQLETEKLLQDHGATDGMTDLISTVQMLAEEHARTVEMEESLIQRTQSLQTLIQDINAGQLQQLAKQLNETVHAELKSRTATVEIEEEGNSVVVDAMSVDDMMDAMDADAMLDDSEAALHNWVVHLVHEEVTQAYATAVATAKAATSTAAVTKPSSSLSSSTTCIRPSDGAQLVQEALSNQQQQQASAKAPAASVVHELTSATYIPPVKESDKMGKVWWRRYIPDDVERLLPAGWQEWNVGLSPATKRLLNLGGAATLPPEAILDANTYPGACWPMAGNKGYVTLRLAQPQPFSGITIEHAPLLDGSTSTPRHFTVTGYPPCATCGLGFNTTAPKVLTMFEFDVASGGHSQKFTALPDLPQEGSCELTKPTCGEDGGDPGEMIGGIRIEITGNWGHDDYTCLYRVVVQK